MPGVQQRNTALLEAGALINNGRFQVGDQLVRLICSGFGANQIVNVAADFTGVLPPATYTPVVERGIGLALSTTNTLIELSMPGFYQLQIPGALAGTAKVVMQENAGDYAEPVDFIHSV
jgi:hypothetical protein